jgi:hypothetical protein
MKVVIISYSRSGSQALQRLIAAGMDLENLGEPFTAYEDHYHAAELCDSLRQQLYSRDGYVLKVLSHNYYNLFGCEWRYLDFAQFDRVVLLHRSDLVACAASRHVSLTTDIWVDTEIITTGSYAIGQSETRKFVQKILLPYHRIRAQLIASGCRFHELEYTQLASGSARSDLFRYLGLAGATPGFVWRDSTTVDHCLNRAEVHSWIIEELTHSGQ